MRKAKIIVVEDNIDNQNLLRLLLEREGFQVATAINGREGLEMIRQEQPELIVLDLSMPIVDGWELIKHVKADPKIGSIPIVVVTAYLQPGEKIRVFEAGCNGYVFKPFKVSDLMDEIERCLPKGK
jgi:two-component system cell cycle response regulator DivK